VGSPPRLAPAAEPARRLGIGLDFGTSNSTIAWFDGGQLHCVPLEGDSPVLPTAVHLDRSYLALTGQAAINQYIDENRGRRVELVAEIIGEAASSIGGNNTGEDISRLETRRHVIFGPLVDRGLPGRLFQGLKRLVGDPDMERIPVFERSFRLVALLTPILERIRHGVERDARGLVPIHAGRPIHFEGRHPDRNACAMGRLSEALAHAGLGAKAFYPEPLGATLSFLHRNPPDSPGIALTVDFGGGTLDLSVVRYAGAGPGFELLGTAGVALGGDRIDQMIFEAMLFPLMGKGENWVRMVDGRMIETLFPFEEFERELLNWPITHLLNQNRTRTMVVDRLSKGGPAAEKFERLHDIISWNYGYTAFQAIRLAKAQLSTVEETVIDIPELNICVPFRRAQLESILGPVLQALRAQLDSVLGASGIDASQVSVVVRTGGSSQIVAVRALLESLFPGRVVEHDPFTSVAAGLAIASFHGYIRVHG
jgi:hypothetical chaperone protein